MKKLVTCAGCIHNVGNHCRHPDLPQSMDKFPAFTVRRLGQCHGRKERPNAKKD